MRSILRQHAGTYNGPGSGDPDFNTIGCWTATFYDEVLSNLGPDGLPVYNTASTAPKIHDVNHAGEITVESGHELEW